MSEHHRKFERSEEMRDFELMIDKMRGIEVQLVNDGFRVERLTNGLLIIPII